MMAIEQNEVRLGVLPERPIVDESVAGRAIYLLQQHIDDEMISNQVYATFLQTSDSNPIK